MERHITCYCSTCGKSFGARRRSAKYCSTACKSKAQRQRRSGDVKSWDGTPLVDQAKLKVLERLAPSTAKMVYSIPFAHGRRAGRLALDVAFDALIEADRWDIAPIFKQEFDNLKRGLVRYAQDRPSDNQR